MQLTQPDQQLLYRPEGAAEVLDVGRSKVFELMADGQIESVRIGRSRRIPRQALLDYVERLRASDGVPGGMTLAGHSFAEAADEMLDVDSEGVPDERRSTSGRPARSRVTGVDDARGAP